MSITVTYHAYNVSDGTVLQICFVLQLVGVEITHEGVECKLEAKNHRNYAKIVVVNRSENVCSFRFIIKQHRQLKKYLLLVTAAILNGGQGYQTSFWKGAHIHVGIIPAKFGSVVRILFLKIYTN